MSAINKKVCTFMFLLSITLSLFSQNIECDSIVFLYFNSSDKKSDKFISSKTKEKIEFPLKVKAYLKINNWDNDTVELKTNVRLSILGPTGLKVGLIKRKEVISYLPSWIEKHQGTDFLTDTQSLKFILPKNKKSANICMQYSVSGTSFLRYKPDNLYFDPQQQRQEYFYPMNLPIRKMNIIVPDSMKCFSSHESDKDGKIKNINLAFILTDHYFTNSIKGEKYEVGIYIPNALKDDSRTKHSISELQKYMNRFSQYIGNKHSSNIIIINFRDDKKNRASGESFGSYVVCDMNLGSEGFLHEIMHSFLPSNIKEESKGEFFMKESIIEWLSLFLSDSKIKKCKKDEASSTSLYDIQINNRNSWDKIYNTGPSIIEQIATQCGRDKMAKMIISFLEKNRNQVTNYNNFINYLNLHLPSNLVTKMDHLVKNI